MKRILRAFAVGAVLLVGLGEGIDGAQASADLEVVQSVPLETTLAVPGIRQTQEVWLEMISAAQSSLDLEQFYVSNEAGQALDPVIQAIFKAAARGVRVRLLVDQKFYKTYPDTVNQIGRTPNCEAREIDFSTYGGVQHAKYFIVDGKQAFLGSQNFDWRALSHIHEVGVRTTDSGIISGLQQVFAKDWAAAVGQNGAASIEADALSLAQSSLQLVASPPAANPGNLPDTLSTLTSLLDSAKTSVRVQVMEYSTKTYSSANSGSTSDTGASWSTLDSALRKAAARGVHVQLMVDVSDLKSASKDLKALAKVQGVEVMSITIPQYSGGSIDYARLIHSKYLIVDGATVWVGTENWSKSYFTQTRNVGIVARDATVVSQLSQVFNQVWTSGYGAKVQ